MPYVDAGLPFSGTTPQSAHASRAGAEDASKRALSQTIRYLALLRHRGDLGLTDWEAADLLNVERTSINARRAALVKAHLVVPGGFRNGPTGVKNVVWKCT